MTKKLFFASLSFLLAMIVTPATFAQPDSRNDVFYIEDSGGSSYLGVQTEDVTPDRVSQLHLNEERGVEVTTVDQDAPASKAGLKEHDVILSVNDQKIESVEQLKRVIRETPAGRTVSIGISRNGQLMTLKAQLAEREKMTDMDHGFSFTMPPIPPINIPAIHIPPINMPEMDFGPIVVIHSFERSGLMVENLTPQLGDFFGVKNGTGVLVRSVEKGSRGEQAGFRAGDVITKINGSEVSDCSDFSRLLRKRSDNKASVTVMRDRKEQTLTLALPEPRRTGELKQSCAEDWDDCAEQLKVDAAQLVPEMKTADLRKIAPALERMQKEMVQMRPELEKMQKTMQEQTAICKKSLHQDMEKVQHELQQEQKELQKQLKEWVKDSEI
jgi:serine protease Do